MRNIFFNFVKLLQGVFLAEVDGILEKINTLKVFSLQGYPNRPAN